MDLFDFFVQLISNLAWSFYTYLLCDPLGQAFLAVILLGLFLLYRDEYKARARRDLAHRVRKAEYARRRELEDLR